VLLAEGQAVAAAFAEVELPDEEVPPPLLRTILRPLALAVVVVSVAL